MEGGRQWEGENEKVEREGVRGEDKHLWGSQLLNNSGRETRSTQCRGGALSGQLIHCRGAAERAAARERGTESIKIARERERERGRHYRWRLCPLCACIIFACVSV